MEFDAQAGGTYYFAFQTQAVFFDFTGPQPIYATVTPPPVNDQFQNALIIEHASSANLSGSFFAATRQTGEPDLAPDFAGPSVWFNWKIDTFGTATLKSTHPAAVFRGSALNDLTLVSKSASEAVSFFAEEGTDYWIALYKGASVTNEFGVEVRCPKYRLYETTLEQLFPTGFVPSFHGLRGVTAILYENTVAGWKPVEIERIINQATIMTNCPSAALEGKLRITTIDDEMPSPRVQLVADASGLQPILRGYVGQSGFISYARDLTNWTPYAAFTLTAQSTPLTAKNSPADATFYYRVTQSMPDNSTPARTVGP